MRTLVKYAGALAVYPARTLFAWYAGLVAVGTGLLLLPVCHAGGVGLDVSRAFFTAASAATVTGLMVISAGSDLSFAGQLVVLALIQLGGLGVMSIGTLLFVSVTGQQPVRFHMLTGETLGARLGADVARMIVLVVAVTLALEAIGALALVVARLGEGPFGEVLWWAVFHSVSGFCNAGIGLEATSLAAWSGNPAVLLTMAALIVAGGLGFPVLLDLFHARRRDGDRRNLRLHTRLVVTASAILLVGGAAAFWMLERNGVLAAMPAGEAAMNALFLSATARTAGFSTMPVEQLAYPALLILLLLMVIGGGSCSTAGGIKVSTAAVLALEGWARVRHRWQVAVFGRGIPDRMLRTAAAVVAVYGVGLLAGITALLVLETGNRPHLEAGGAFLDVVFEAVSALGTVGLSTGITAQLSEPSRLIIALMMLLGRVGPLSIASILLLSPRGPKIRYPEREVIVG